MLTEVDQSFLKHFPQAENPDLFNLITAQATIRLSLEKKWLADYVIYLEDEEEKRQEQEKKWLVEKRERTRRTKEKERAKTKVREPY